MFVRGKRRKGVREKRLILFPFSFTPFLLL